MDIEGVSHVINYDIPRDVAYYIHSIGSTCRSGVLTYLSAGRTKADLYIKAVRKLTFLNSLP